MRAERTDVAQPEPSFDGHDLVQNLLSSFLFLLLLLSRAAETRKATAQTKSLFFFMWLNPPWSHVFAVVAWRGQTVKKNNLCPFRYDLVMPPSHDVLILLDHVVRISWCQKLKRQARHHNWLISLVAISSLLGSYSRIKRSTGTFSTACAYHLGMPINA